MRFEKILIELTGGDIGFFGSGVIPRNFPKRVCVSNILALFKLYGRQY